MQVINQFKITTLRAKLMAVCLLLLGIPGLIIGLVGYQISANRIAVLKHKFELIFSNETNLLLRGGYVMIETGFNNKMTNNMLSLLDGFQEEMEREYLYCNEQYLKFKDAIVKLPYINENGVNVVHGSNMVFKNISYYWLVRRDATVKYLSKEFIEKNDVDTIVTHK